MPEELLIDPESVIPINSKSRKGEVTMHNNSVNGKAFKIKTTKPNDCSVRPNIGTIQPLQKVQVEILVQDHTIASEDHKFLIEIYQFDWRKSVNEFKDFLKETKQKPMSKKLLGIKFIGDESGTKESTLAPRKMKDYLEIVCLLFLFVQFIFLCFRLFS